jgi:uncharacterized membrane protein
MDAAIERHRDSIGVARGIIIWLALSLIINFIIAFSIAALTNWLVAVFIGGTVDILLAAYVAFLLPTLVWTRSICLMIQTNNAQNDKAKSYEDEM